MNRPALPAVVAGLALALACAKAPDAAEESKGHAEVAASVGTVEMATFRESIDAVGTVMARVGHLAVLAAPAPTRVSRVFVTVGAQVSAGDPLVEFEQAPFAAALNSANAALASAEKAAARALRLADAGVSPRKDAEMAATELATAQAGVVNARRANELSTLHAPMSGVVTRLSAVMGASVEPNQALVEVADPALLDVMLVVPPSDAAHVRVGQGVALMGDAAGGESLASARVANVSPAVDSASRGVPVRAEVTSGAAALRIGASVTGRIMTAEHSRVTIVPNESLVPTGEGFKVFVVDTNGVALSREVTVGGRSAQGVWIRSGLRAGERIVTRGAYGMDDSAKVAVPSAKTLPGKAPPEKSAAEKAAPRAP